MVAMKAFLAEEQKMGRESLFERLVRRVTHCAVAPAFGQLSVQRARLYEGARR